MKTSTLHLILISCIIISCDVLVDDSIPVQEESLQIQNELFSTPNTPLIIDLKTRLRFSNEAEVVISRHPEKGTVGFKKSGLLQYTPTSSYSSGRDLFILDIIEKSGHVIDSDSVNIVMVGDSSQLPCFNGALSDFVTVKKNKPKVINVLNNDGICEGMYDRLKLWMVENPGHGVAMVSDSSQIEYIPDNGYTGPDTLRYALEITDLNGEIHNSTANVFINVYETPKLDSCITKVKADTFAINTHTQKYFSLRVLDNDNICDSTCFSFAISQAPSRGIAELMDSTAGSGYSYINYTIDMADENYQDYFEYTIINDKTGKQYTAGVSIFQEACKLKAEDDIYRINTEYDSTLLETYVIDVMDNDRHCYNSTTITLNGDGYYKGSVDVVDNKIHYSPDSYENRIDSVGYSICEIYECDKGLLIIEFNP